MKYGAGQVSAPTELRSRLGQGTEISGEIRFSEVLRVDGVVSGKLTSDSGNLVVSERGHVKAQIEVGFVEVFGTIEGTIRAQYKVEIRPGGRVRGDIFTPVLSIEYGATFDGTCHMKEGKPTPSAATPATMANKPSQQSKVS